MKEGEARSFQGLREDKGGAWRARFAGMLDAWRSSPASRRRYGHWASTVEALELHSKLV